MSDLIKRADDADLEVMPSFDFVFEKEAEQQTQIAEHRAWLKSIKHERPLPKHHFKVAVYIRYFNQTKHEDYLAFHKQQFLDTICLCPNWEFVGFYVDEGGTAPNMEQPRMVESLRCYGEKSTSIITKRQAMFPRSKRNSVSARGYSPRLRNPLASTLFLRTSTLWLHTIRRI